MLDDNTTDAGETGGDSPKSDLNKPHDQESNRSARPLLDILVESIPRHRGCTPLAVPVAYASTS